MLYINLCSTFLFAQNIEVCSGFEEFDETKIMDCSQQSNSYLSKYKLNSITGNPGKIELLTPDAILQLEYMANNFDGLAARQARNILCFFTGNCEELEIVIDDKNNKGKQNGNNKSLETVNNEINQNLELTIIPNPNDGIFELQVPEDCAISDISIVDVNGKKVEFDLLSDTSNKTTIQLISSQPGIHIINSVCNDGSNYSGRILIVSNN